MPVAYQTLKKRASFQRHTKYGRRYYTDTFVLQVMPVKQLPEEVVLNPGQVAAGFTASKKVGKAVQRNYAKRRLRAAFHEIVLEHKWPATHSYVLIARDVVLTAQFSDVCKQMKSIKEKVIFS